jgi:hypothetical protein
MLLPALLLLALLLPALPLVVEGFGGGGEGLGGVEGRGGGDARRSSVLVAFSCTHASNQRCQSSWPTVTTTNSRRRGGGVPPPDVSAG